jgi:NACHT domain
MGNDSVHVDEKLLRLAYEHYPAPLADPFVRLAAEINKLQTDWDRAFNRCIDCFEISVKFVALAATASYIRRACEWKACHRSKGAESCILRLHQSDKPATGHWWELLRQSLQALPEGDECVSILAKRYAERPRSSSVRNGALRDALDTVTNVRNTIKGHGKTLEPADYLPLLIEPYKVLERWYWALDFFQRHWLAIPLACAAEGERYKVDLEILSGNHRYYPRRCVTSTAQLHTGKLYLVEAPAEESIPDDRPPLFLHPFAILNPEEKDDRDVLIFESYTDQEMKYDCGRTGQPYWAKDLQDDFLKALGPVLASHGHLIGMPREVYGFIKPYSERLRQRTRQYVERQQAQRTYRPELQVPRTEPEKSVRDFLESDKSALIINGPSGTGKTCLVCRFAERMLQIEDNDILVLLLGADSLPQSDISLEQAVCEALECDGPLRDWVQQVRRKFRKYKAAWKVVVIVDGIDKHPNILSMVRAIDQWVRVISASLPELKVIATCSPTGLDRAREEIAKLAVERYYAPVREILAGESGAVRLPAIQMSPFTDDEREEAYKKYAETDSKPRTEYKDLKPGARRVLAHPLFLRLVAEAYKGEEVPPNPISFQTLQKYCEPDIFADRNRKAFVDHLVDTMLDLKVRELSGQQLNADARLREAYLGSNPAFDQLVKAQVLAVYRRVKSQFPVPIEEEYVEFTMDRVFQFLLVVRLIERHQGSADIFLLTSGLPNALETAKEFPSLRSGLVDLLAEVARNPQTAEAQKESVLSRLCQLSADGSDNWVREFLSDLLFALADEAVEDHHTQAEADSGPEEQIHDPFRATVDVILANLGEAAMPLFSETVEDLFRRALWRPAIVLLLHLAEARNLSELNRFSVQNKLVVLLKNQDRWEMAQNFSNRNEELLQQIEKNGPVPARLRSRHWLNRFSVLYDLGKRKEALQLCEQANQIARADGLKLEHAATANNLGIAQIYFDHPALAEEHLTDGIAAAIARRRNPARGCQRHRRSAQAVPENGVRPGNPLRSCQQGTHPPVRSPHAETLPGVDAAGTMAGTPELPGLPGQVSRGAGAHGAGPRHGRTARRRLAQLWDSDRPGAVEPLASVAESGGSAAVCRRRLLPGGQ